MQQPKQRTAHTSRILTRRPECLLARPADGEGERTEFIKCTGAFQRDECQEHYLLVCGLPRFNNQHVRLIVVVKLRIQLNLSFKRVKDPLAPVCGKTFIAGMALLCMAEQMTSKTNRSELTGRCGRNPSCQTSQGREKMTASHTAWSACRQSLLARRRQSQAQPIFVHR